MLLKGHINRSKEHVQPTTDMIRYNYYAKFAVGAPNSDTQNTRRNHSHIIRYAARLGLLYYVQKQVRLCHSTHMFRATAARTTHTHGAFATTAYPLAKISTKQSVLFVQVQTPISCVNSC